MALKPGWYPEDDGRERYWDGTKWTDAYRGEAARPEGGGEAAKKKSSGGAAIVGIVLVLLFICGVASCLNGGDSDDDSTNQGYQVQVTCEDLVKKSMKNPSSVEFSEQSRTATSAVGLATAENALGGKVTYNYRCSASGSRVTLDSLTER